MTVFGHVVSLIVLHFLKIFATPTM